MKERMRIGEVAQQAGVTPRTIRHYESLGLLPSGERRGQGHHYYSGATVSRLTKIDQLKRLGLSLEEIGEVIELYFTDPSGVRPKQKVLPMLREHLAESERRLSELEQFRDELRTAIGHFERFLTEADSS